jgi:hypothetical protein
MGQSVCYKIYFYTFPDWTTTKIKINPLKKDKEETVAENRKTTKIIFVQK